MGQLVEWYGDKTTRKPSKGCELCALGAKLVLFITGICPNKCYYCSISKGRRHKITFANEQRITDVPEAITEAEKISALGAGITGGEPTLEQNKILHYITSFKSHFGSQFHFHLYTSVPLNQDQLQSLHNVGLDEIRFHPPRLDLTQSIKNTILRAKQFNWDLGIEIPIIPNSLTPIEKIIQFAIDNSIDFINFNEFEFTQTNYRELKKRGFEPKNSFTAAVQGSEEMALSLLKKYEEESITLHYCSSRFKDRIQLTNRFLRRAKNTARQFDEITPEGLLNRGRIITTNEQLLHEITQFIKEHLEVPGELIEIQIEENTILTHWSIVRDFGQELTEIFPDITRVDVIEQYPYPNGFITYSDPIYEKEEKST